MFSPKKEREREIERQAKEGSDRLKVEIWSHMQTQKNMKKDDFDDRRGRRKQERKKKKKRGN